MLDDSQILSDISLKKVSFFCEWEGYFNIFYEWEGKGDGKMRGLKETQILYQEKYPSAKITPQN